MKLLPHKLPALSWLLLILAAYYAAFPPLQMLGELPKIVPFHPSSEPLRSLACLILFMVSAAGWGMLAVRPAAPAAETLLTAFAAGAGMLSLLVLLANALGMASPALFYALLAAGTLIALGKGRREIAAPAARRRQLFRPLSPSGAIFCLAASLPLGATLIAALAPPTQFDSLVYHLAFPARYLREGGLHFIPHSIFFAFPQNAEMLFQAALAVDSDILANLLSWLFYALTAAGIYLFSRRYSGTTARAAGLIWLYSPAVMFIATGTYVDTALAFFCFTAWYAFTLARERADGSFLLPGFIAGTALGVKYTAAAFILPLFILILARPGRLKASLFFGAGLCAAFAPWLVKNILLLHNPAAPWGAALFAGSRVAPETAAGYFAHIAGHGIPLHSFVDYLTLPWKLTVSGALFGGAFDLPGPAWLMFLPLLFLRGENSKIKQLFFVVFCFLAAWLATGKVLRFLVPVMPLAAIAAARGYEGFSLRAPKTAAIVMAAALLHNFLMFHWVMARVDPYAVVLRGESRDSYLGRTVSCYPAVTGAVNRLPSSARVLFWGETRGYFCRAEALVPSAFDASPLAAAANRAKGPGELAELLKRGSLTHILFNRAEAGRLHPETALTESGGKTLAALLAVSPVRYEDRACTLYELP